MKKGQGLSIENTFGNLGFEILTTNELSEVRGGSRPKSRDKDVYDDDFEDGGN
jgi:bacteriocin-like protein